MPFQPIPNCARVTARGTQSVGEVWANVFHIKWDVTDPYDASIRALMRDAVVTFYTALETSWPTEWSLTHVDVRSIETEGSPTFSFPVSGVVGTSTAPSLPPQVCVGVSWAVGADEVRKMGRTFLPAPSTATVDQDGGILEVTKDQVGAAARAFIDEVEGALTPLSGLHIVSRLGAGSAVQVTAAYLDRWFDTQRRRRDELVPSYEKY